MIRISICVDCLQYLANGPSELEPSRVAEIEAGITREGGQVWPDCGEECEGGFSWSPCELCGSTLGGERHNAVILAARQAERADSPDLGNMPHNGVA